jgi:type IV pilus assembly protein PilY1
MWRFGKFTDAGGDPLDFPECDENISNWTGQVLFNATNARKFYYPPSITLEKGYDAVFFGTGDREDACATGTSDRIYCVKDTHADTTLQEVNLVDVTDPAAAVPDLSDDTSDVDTNGNIDQGWYIQLAAGEKVLAEGTVFYKTFYVTTFSPNNDPCLPGGTAKLYALAHLTGGAVIDFDGNDSAERSTEIGGGIPSKPVTVITETGQKLFMSVGSTNPDGQSEEIGAGIKAVDPLAPSNNFFTSWWEEL